MNQVKISFPIDRLMRIVEEPPETFSLIRAQIEGGNVVVVIESRETWHSSDHPISWSEFRTRNRANKLGRPPSKELVDPGFERHPKRIPAMPREEPPRKKREDAPTKPVEPEAPAQQEVPV